MFLILRENLKFNGKLETQGVKIISKNSMLLQIHFVALMSLNWDVINLIQNCPALSILCAEFVEFYLTHHCTGKWRPLSAFSRPSCMPMAPHSSTFLVLLVPWFPSFALTHTSVSNSIALHTI